MMSKRQYNKNLDACVPYCCGDENHIDSLVLLTKAAEALFD